MGNLSREALAHYLDYSFKQTVASATWEILGDDIDDMSVDLNPDTETKKNILGQTKTTDNGYEPSMDADTYYANPDKKLKRSGLQNTYVGSPCGRYKCRKPPCVCRRGYGKTSVLWWRYIWRKHSVQSIF